MSPELGQIDDVVLGGLRPPSRGYYLALGLLGLGVVVFFLSWLFQIKAGMGIAGISHPVGWATYIGNFVFWVGIAHSGTLISAILHLVRAKWRNSVSRAAEAMTIFAIMTAGLFPLIHLGRVWVFYYIFPYPSQRQLWPDFISPLVWDVVAITTYFTVSLIFWYVGLVPDLAAARDRWELSHGPNHIRTRIYRRLALGWMGAGSQWRHFGRAYLYFAALATPLVVSVHSVVSWDFAMANLPGWHSTIFAPYFVAGAIHSGLAMVLTLVVPLRRFLKLDKVIHIKHFESVALTMLVTTAIVGYTYLIEPFLAWYSGDVFEKQFAWWRAMEGPWLIFWALPVLNVLVPLLFVFKRFRTNLRSLFIISILVNVGMWLERVLIVYSSTSHDFMPHNWGGYWPRPIEVLITVGAFCWFLMWFFLFAKGLPTVPATDLKEEVVQGRLDKREEVPSEARPKVARRAQTGLLAIYAQPEKMLSALRRAQAEGFTQADYFSPARIVGEEAAMGQRRSSPVRYWTLIGALSGLAGGFALSIGSALVNNLIVGGKSPISIVPYVIVGFEGTILLGALATFAGMLFHARLGREKLPPWYDRRFTRDRFAVLVPCRPEQADRAMAWLRETNPEEIRELMGQKAATA